jgi:hypothetical protein
MSQTKAKKALPSQIISILLFYIQNIRIYRTEILTKSLNKAHI